MSRNKIPRLGPKIVTLASLNEKINRLEKTIAKNKLADEIKYKSLENLTVLMAAFASHDIKNAIHNMDGVVSLISVDTITEQDIQLIQECALRLRESLEEFSKIGLPQLAGNPEPFEVVRLMSSLNTLHRYIMEYEQIEYRVVYLLSKSTAITQDFHTLVQALNNILINSTTALTGIINKRIQVTLSLEGENLTILISDNGRGIPPENREKIFTPYFTTTGGSGIGLAHVSSVMKQINGKVELTTEPGFTTTFKITVPLVCATPS